MDINNGFSIGLSCLLEGTVQGAAVHSKPEHVPAGNRDVLFQFDTKIAGLADGLLVCTAPGVSAFAHIAEFELPPRVE